jgi:hypothetical protein
MARWITLALTVIGFAIAFTTNSPGVLGLGLLLGLVGLIGFVFALAAARVSARARPETSMASVEDLRALRKAAPPVGTPPRRPGDGPSNDAA